MKFLCPICKEPIFPSEVICDDCRAQLDQECFDSFMDRCPVCLYPKANGIYRCTLCQGLGKRRIYSVSRYDGKLSYSVMDSFKFHDNRSLAKVVAMYLKKALDFLDPQGVAVLVPIPCSPARLRRYGWDPMVEVCRALGRPYLPILENTQARKDEQKTLRRTERLQASEGRFSLVENDLDKAAKIIVVDDIVTTMSTMNAALDTLEGQGFTDVSGASWLCEL